LQLINRTLNNDHIVAACSEVFNESIICLWEAVYRERPSTRPLLQKQIQLGYKGKELKTRWVWSV